MRNISIIIEIFSLLLAGALNTICKWATLGRLETASRGIFGE